MLGIDYDEYDVESYRGVFVYAEKEKKTFNLGNLGKDYLAAKAYIKENYPEDTTYHR